jgi:KUP system potassium uptake protein
VIRKLWRWPLWLATSITVPLIIIDMTFLTATLINFFVGAWVPVLMGAVLLLLMGTWRRGIALLAQKTRRIEVPLDTLIAQLEKRSPHQVSGTAIFLTSQPKFAPTALLHNLKHNKMLHERNFIVSVLTEDIPQVADGDRVTLSHLSERFSLVQLRFGYMETPNVPRALATARKLGLKYEIMTTSFFLSRRSLKPSASSGMPRWQDHLFITLSRSANDATDYFQIPTGRVVEVGTQITI